MVRSQPRRSGFLRALVSLLLLIALAASIVLLTSRYMQVGEVQVPEVVGQNVEDARQTLRRLGFEVSTYTDTSLTAPPNVVTSQIPEAEEIVRQGRGVALGLSARETSTVPRVVGLTQAEATAALQDAQLEVSEVTLRNAPRPEGTVLAQQPAGNTAVRQPKVALTVSLGPRTKRVLLPRLIGLPLAEAQQRLEGLGFRRVESIPTRLGLPGVNAQVPAARSQTAVSAQVTLYYTVGNRQVVPVPSILGLDLQRAAERLQGAGLRVGEVTTNPFDSNRPAGVSKVEPSDYTLWGTSVDLETNGNAGTYRVAAPALPQALPSSQAGGQRPSSAQTAVTGQLLPQGTQNGTGSILVQPVTPTQPAQAQTAQLQQPEQATTLDGQPLTLPTRGGRELPITLDPADYTFLQGRAYQVQVQVTDDAGNRIELNREMGPDEALQDTVTLYGNAELRMYIDGQIVLAYNPTSP